jgi:hypothetical protein
MQAALVLNLAASKTAFQVKPPDLHVPEHVEKKVDVSSVSKPFAELKLKLHHIAL